MKTIINILLIVLMPLIFTFNLAAEDDLQIAFDAATFHFDDNETRWELYYSCPDNMFTYQSDTGNNKLIGSIAIRIVVKSKSIALIDENWKISNSINSFEELKQNYIFGVKSFFLAPGQYEIELSAFDMNKTTRRLLYKKDIFIFKFEKNRINQSEIEFASYIEEIKESTLNIDPMYMKYDYYVIPNPRAEFFGNEARLIGALEIYNSEMYSRNGIIRSYKIADNTGEIMYFARDTSRIVTEKILTTFDLPLDTLPSGVYFLAVTTSYPIENAVDSVTSTKKFFFYNQSKPFVRKRYFTENELFEKSEFNTMTPQQTDIEINMAIVIARDEEIYQARSLNDTKAKQRFLFKFWSQRDSDTNTVWNEYLREFRSNVEFANNFFSYGKNSQGWKTERGRVLLKYGMPTNREVHISSGLERAYEEWFYENVQGGVYFYFVDISSIGNFILTHSTAMGETYYPDWFNRYVPTTPDNRMNNDSQNQRQSINPYGN